MKILPHLIRPSGDLIGRVSSQVIKSDADRIARGTSGVKDVKNELVVGKVRR